MKILCEHCGAGYSVADDKVAGRALKLRCKKCSEVIHIDGRQLGQDAGEQPAVEASEPATPGVEHGSPDYGPDPFAEEESQDNDEARAALPDAARGTAADLQEAALQEAAPAREVAQPEDEAVWHIAVGDSTQGPYTLEELATYYAQGSVVLDTLVFRDGWSDWRPAGEVSELTEQARDVFGAPAAADTARAGLAPVAMGDDPFADQAQPPTPRLSGEQVLAKGPGHEGTVQFSLDEIKAISAVSTPSTVPGTTTTPAAASPQSRPGYASGEGSGLIDMRALAQLASSTPQSQQVSEAEDDDSGLSPLDSLMPLSLPSTPVAQDKSFRMKLFAGVAAFAMLLAAGVAALAIVYRPQPVATPASVALPAAKPPVTAAAAAVPPSMEEQAQAEAAEPTETAQDPEQGAEDEERAEPAEHEATTPDAEERAVARRQESAKRSAASPTRPSNRSSTEERARREPKAERKAEPKQRKGADLKDVLVDKRKPEARNRKGGDGSLDDLLLGALSGKKSEGKPARKAARKPERKTASADSKLPMAPSRDAMRTSLGRAAARAKRCPGSGIATAEITIRGANGRASKVDVSGVTGAAKSCVEKAVRGTPFPKFQKDSFQVKFPFRLAK